MGKSREEILSGFAEFKASNSEDAEVGEAVTRDEEPEVESDDETGEEGDGEEEDTEDDDSEEEGDDSESSEDSAEEDEDEEEEEDGDEDSSVDKDLSRLQEEEKQFKQRASAKLKELEDKDAQASEKLAKAEALEKSAKAAVTRFKKAPVFAGKSMGLETADDFKSIGSILYRYGKGISADAEPQHRLWAESIERDGEQAFTLEEVKSRLEKSDAEKAESAEKAKAEAATKAQQEETNKVLGEFATQVISGVSEKYPVAKAILSAEDDGIKDVVIALAQEIAGKTGKPPSNKQIFEEIERYERARLSRLGLDPDALFPRKKTKTKDEPGTAPKKKKAKVKSKNKSSQKKTGNKEPYRKKSREEVLEGLRRAKEQAQQQA